MRINAKRAPPPVRSRGMLLSIGLAVLLLAAGAASRPAAADVILQQNPIPNGGGVGSIGLFRSFDDFTLGAATSITAVRWWEFNFLGVRTQDFTITFTDTVNSIFPNATAPLYQTTVTATGTLVGAFLHQYEAVLPTPASLPGNTNLWLSIVDVTPNALGFTWNRASNVPSPGALPVGFMASVRPDGSTLHQAIDAAWALISDPVPLSEPGTPLLLATGIASLSVLRRRRRG